MLRDYGLSLCSRELCDKLASLVLPQRVLFGWWLGMLLLRWRCSWRDVLCGFIVPVPRVVDNTAGFADLCR